MSVGAAESVARSQAPAPAPRLGFVGLGWIGAQRMRAVIEAGAAEAVALTDPSTDALEAALSAAPGSRAVASLEELLELPLDAVVLATPNALHAQQAVTALERGLAVFCQKPLGRTRDETGRVVAAARRANRLLGVDLSYRSVRGMQLIRDRVRDRELGDVYAVELVFHNAYGPDKAWFRDLALSGGGCVMDLGVHLVDLALWTLDWPVVERVQSRLVAAGRPLAARADVVEDFAFATIDLAGGCTARLACSWNLSAGRDAVIEVAFYGTRGGAVLRNVGGSFYDFVAELFHGTRREVLAVPPDPWPGRALVEWCGDLLRNPGFDPAAERCLVVADVLDRVYGR